MEIKLTNIVSSIKCYRQKAPRFVFLQGQKCDQVAPGAFLPGFDFFHLEAEDSQSVSRKIVLRDHGYKTWTGDGFVEMRPSESLSFEIGQGDLPKTSVPLLFIPFLRIKPVSIKLKKQKLSYKKTNLKNYILYDKFYFLWRSPCFSGVFLGKSAMTKNARRCRVDNRINFSFVFSLVKMIIAIRALCATY